MTTHGSTTSVPSPAFEGELCGHTIEGKYELVRLLGEGGMGAVYEGRNTATLKRVAVKLLYQEFGKDEGVVGRFFREAKASSIVESDYIVQIFDSGTDSVRKLPFMVMEMLQGEDVQQMVERVGPVHPMAVAKIILQATMGLGKAHEAGITHRDIKPANLFLTSREDGDIVLKILDFGIAKIRAGQFSDQSTAGLTATGSVLGTPLYMSPEQARGLNTVDARSDVWSLGVVMYELLSGSIPYTGAQTLGDLMVAIITADLPLLQDKAPWVPPELAEITHRAMSRDVERRFRHAGEMRDALLRLVPDGPRLTREMLVAVPDQARAFVAPRLELADGMLRATTHTGLAIGQRGPAPRARSSGSAAAPIAAAALGLLVLAGGAFGVWRLTRDRPTPVAGQAASGVVSPVPATSRESGDRAAEGVSRSFALVVIPTDAEVFVDEKKVPVSDETVILTGAPGETRTVRITKGGKETQRMVAITRNGLVPPKIELIDAGKKPAPGAPGKSPKLAGSARGDAKDKPPDTAKPAGKPLKTDTTEFQ